MTTPPVPPLPRTAKQAPKPLFAFHMPTWPTVLGWITGLATLIVTAPYVIPESTWATFPAWASAARMGAVFAAGAILWLTKKPGAPSTATLITEGQELIALRASVPPPRPATIRGDVPVVAPRTPKDAPTLPQDHVDQDAPTKPGAS